MADATDAEYVANTQIDVQLKFSLPPFHLQNPASL